MKKKNRYDYLLTILFGDLLAGLSWYGFACLALDWVALLTRNLLALLFRNLLALVAFDLKVQLY